VGGGRGGGLGGRVRGGADERLGGDDRMGGEDRSGGDDPSGDEGREDQSRRLDGAAGRTTTSRMRGEEKGLEGAPAAGVGGNLGVFP